jgi:hypothetical protein
MNKSHDLIVDDLIHVFPKRDPIDKIVGCHADLPTGTLLYAHLCVNEKMEMFYAFHLTQDKRIIKFTTEVAGSPRIDICYMDDTLVIDYSDLQNALVHWYGSTTQNYPEYIAFHIRIMPARASFNALVRIRELESRIDDIQVRFKQLAQRLDQVYYMPGAPGFLMAQNEWNDFFEEE